MERQAANPLLLRLLKNTSWLSAPTPVNLVLGLVQTGLLTRLLGVDGFGALAVLMAVAAVFGGTFGTSSAETVIVYGTRALKRDDEGELAHLIRHCYWLDLSTSFVAYVVLSAFTVLIWPFVMEQGQSSLQLLYGLIVVPQSVRWVSQSILRLWDRFSWIFYQAVGYQVLRTIVIVLLFIFRADLRQIVFVLLGLAVLDNGSLLAGAFTLMRRKGLALHRQRRWWDIPVEVRSFQLLCFWRRVTKSLYRSQDVLLLGYLAQPAAAGLYRAAKQLIGLLDAPIQALGLSLSPEFSRLWFEGDIGQLKGVVFRLSALLAALSATAVFVMLLVADPIQIIYGSDFARARGLFLVLLISLFINVVMVPLNVLQSATGRAWPATLAGFATVALQAGAMLLLVPRMGASGAAWATVAAVAASAAIMIPTGLGRLRAKSPHTASISATNPD